ncbi:MAG TPA: hypothetical protein VGM21_02710 [Actinomycetota bacterium]
MYLLEDELSQQQQRELAARSQRAEGRHRHALRLAEAGELAGRKQLRARLRAIWAR